MTKWYMRRGDKDIGPGSEEQLRAAFKKGAINLETKVRREDSQDWMTLKESLLISDEDANPFVGAESSADKQATKQAAPQVFGREMFQQKPVYNEGRRAPEYASLVDRTIALVIDSFVIMVVSLLTMRLGMIGVLLNTVIGFGYFVMFQQEWGYTIGRKMMGIHVETLSGQKPDMRVFAIRYFSSLLSCLLMGLGYILIAFSGMNQTLHDKLAQTVVVRDPR